MKAPKLIVEDVVVSSDGVDYINRPVEFIEREGKLLCADPLIVDYYGECGEDMFIDPILEDWAEENGFEIEWLNPEAVEIIKA